MKILITGASGFIGRALLKILSRRKHDVLAFSRNPPLIEDSSVTWKCVDLNQPLSYRKHLFDFAPEAVIHLAWQDIPKFSLSTCLTNLQNSLNFFDSLFEIDNCKKILVAGSCWEVNKNKGECLETEIGSQRDHFTWAKQSLRNWLELETSKKGVILGWIRIFYVYGPMQREASLIPTILSELKKRKLPRIKNLHNANDFVFIDDVASGFVRAVEHKSPNGIFHLGSGYSTKISHICYLAEQIVWGNTTLTAKLLEMYPDKSQSEVNFWANCERSYQLFGWTPQTSLQKGIQKTKDWMYSL